MVVARLPQADYEVVVARVSATRFAAAAVEVSIVRIAEGLELHVEVVGPTCLPRQRLQREERGSRFERRVSAACFTERSSKGSTPRQLCGHIVPYQ